MPAKRPAPSATCPEQFNITEEMFVEMAPGASGQAPPRKKKSPSGKTRPPARPHKRVDNATLVSRILEMQKRAKNMQAKLVILEDRLAAHEREAEMREGGV